MGTKSIATEIGEDAKAIFKKMEKQLDENTQMLNRCNRLLTEAMNQRDRAIDEREHWKAQALSAQASLRRVDPMQALNDSSELREAGRIIGELRALIWMTRRTEKAIKNNFGAERIDAAFERCTRFLKVRGWGAYGPK